MIQGNIFQQIKPHGVSDLKEAAYVRVKKENGTYKVTFNVSMALGERLGWKDGDGVYVGYANHVLRIEKANVVDTFTLGKKGEAKWFSFTVTWHNSFNLQEDKRNYVEYRIDGSSIYLDLKKV